MSDYEDDYSGPTEDDYINWNEADDYADEEPEDDGQPDEQFEWESSMASAGWGTDEDYGYYGGDEY